MKDYLAKRGCWFVKFFANRNTERGIPDLLCCIGGHFVGLEIKGPTGRPSEIQLWNVEQIKKAGGRAMVLWPKDWDVFRALVDELTGGD